MRNKATTRAALGLLLGAAVIGLLLAVSFRRGGAVEEHHDAAAPGEHRVQFSGVVRDLRGHALVGARVEPTWLGENADPLVLPAGDTDAQGTYALNITLPAQGDGVMLLRASAAGHETSGRRVELREPRQNFVLADGGARVTVRVRDALDRPVRQAAVVLSAEPEAGEPGAMAVFTGRTDMAGQLVVEAVTGAAAALHWSVQAEGRGSAHGMQEKPWGSRPVVIDARLRTGARLEVLAREAGEPMEGITISVRQSVGPWGKSARTGANGSLGISDVPTGEDLVLAVDSSEHMLASGQDEVTFSIPSGNARHALSIELQPAGAIVGRVESMLGAAIEGASVEAVPADRKMAARRVTTSDVNGRFQLGGLRTDSRWELTVRHADYAPGFLDAIQPARRGPQVLARLAEGGAVAGRVQYEGGAPARDVEIYVHRVQRDERGVQGLKEYATTRTGVDGRFLIEHINPGALRVEVRARARMAWSPTAAKVLDANVFESKTAALPTVMLPGESGLRFVWNSSPPLPDAVAEVSLMNAGARGAPHVVVAQASTDGTFRVQQLEPGRYDVSVRLESQGQSSYPGVQLAAGETTELVLNASSGVTLTGIVRRPDGKAAAGARVDAYLPEAGSQKTYSLDGRAPDNFSGNHARTAADGSFSVIGLTREVYLVRITDEHEAPLQRRIYVSSGGPREEFRFPPPAIAMVQLLDNQRQPVSNRVVVLSQLDPDENYSVSGITDAKGSARFERLPPGRFVARAVVEGQPMIELKAERGKTVLAVIRSQ